MFLFERKGAVRIALDEGDDLDAKIERVADAALDAGAEDFETDEPSDGTVEIEVRCYESCLFGCRLSHTPASIQFKCDPATLSKLTAAVTAPGLAKELLGSELVYAPVDKVDIPDEELTNKVSTLVDCLEELEDTLSVWTTLD